MKIAVDFDGTIVEHRYPQIGREIPFATLTLKKLMAEGNILVLNTVRQGRLLDEAVAWCEERGVTFFAVNSNYPEETPQMPDYSRKIKADIYIDDRNLGGLPDWGVIYDMIVHHKSFSDLIDEQSGDRSRRKKHWWSRG